MPKAVPKPKKPRKPKPLPKPQPFRDHIHVDPADIFVNFIPNTSPVRSRNVVWNRTRPKHLWGPILTQGQKRKGAFQRTHQIMACVVYNFVTIRGRKLDFLLGPNDEAWCLVMCRPNSFAGREFFIAYNPETELYHSVRSNHDTPSQWHFEIVKRIRTTAVQTDKLDTLDKEIIEHAIKNFLEEDTGVE